MVAGEGGFSGNEAVFRWVVVQTYGRIGASLLAYSGGKGRLTHRSMTLLLLGV